MLENARFPFGFLSGSVVRIGAQWSVVKSSGPGKLVVWGKITDQAAQLEVLDHYTVKDKP